MELSATTRPAHAGSQFAGAGTADLGLEPGIDLSTLGADLGIHPGAGVETDGEPEFTDSVVVHVQLRPRRPAVRKCLAALVALAAEHPLVAFELTGLSKDDRVARVTVGIDLGARAEVAKFSASAQAAYLFVDGLFTSLYDYMPVYVAEPSDAERSATVGVLDAVAAPRPFIPAPRRSESAPATGSPAQDARRAVPVHA
ncbi:hypothetical protein SAMN05661080_01570 [Modestobacter sp. DSM 44400]|uniref:hypothetical protein n=1 Tax=Modestobacter sp. DSM 44400 TaxID=1550230 RepID=UPI000895E96E|nr:hypothetical protein [Modestobacter sp. DSM 44400]SDX88059.1 hypothetical protein SAMN05661080_01570 [Modestobacter sp. DSM 44400]